MFRANCDDADGSANDSCEDQTRFGQETAEPSTPAPEPSTRVPESPSPTAAARRRRRARADAKLAAAGLRALAAFRRFCRVAASLDQSGLRSRGAAEVCSCWSWAGVLRELLRRNALALLLHCTACVRVPTLSSGSGLSSLVCL